MRNIIKLFRNKYYRNKEMVSYWKKQDMVEAKVVVSKAGHYEMYMQGEKYPFPGFPRGTLLYGNLSPLKHWIKNKVFNDAWAMLEDNIPSAQIIQYLRREVLPFIFQLSEESKYDMVPYERMVPPIKELWRALSVVERKTGSQNVRKFKEMLCFILQEDDAYRFRFQWIIKFFPWIRKLSVKQFDHALGLLEHAEIVGDMKGRMRLLRRVIMMVLSDETMLRYFHLLMDELDFKKLRLTKADKYFFRAKYFKVDYPNYDY